MRRIFPLAALAALAGCGTAGPRDLGARLLDWPEVASADRIDPASLLLTVDEAGRIYRKGQATKLSEIAELRGAGPQVNSEPILLEVNAKCSVGSLREVLEGLVRAWRVNVSFLVRTPSGAGALSMPIIVEHACDRLLFYDGAERYVDRDDDMVHLWIGARVGKDGAILVQSLRHGYLVETCFPDAQARGTDDRFEWGKDHPPFGIWTTETLRGFLDAPHVAGLSPFCDLVINSGDNVQDALQCLSALKAAAGGKVVAEMVLN